MWYVIKRSDMKGRYPGQRCVALNLLFVLFAVVVFPGCGVSQPSEPSKRTALASPSVVQTEKKGMQPADLKKRYMSATSEDERRAICLQAIDAAAFVENGPVSAVDEIFGTNFASKLPTKKEGTRDGMVYFADQPPARKPADGLIQQRAFVGWYLLVQYDHNGEIQNYYLSNLHK
jgi:hypothetical protein